MPVEKYFYRMAAICGFLTALSTFFLWLLPKFYGVPTNWEEELALAQNPFYLGRLWVNFLHIPLALTSYFGLTYGLKEKSLPFAGLGMLWFLIWGITEMLGVALLIFSLNGNWRIIYPHASQAVQDQLFISIQTLESIWDSLFFVILISFLLGTFFMGWASWREKGLGKWLSILFYLAVPLTLVILLQRYGGLPSLDSWVTWMYPILQPISRAILGLVLWRKASNLAG
ncbi:MAG: hypothetical protein AAF694_13845 [Bacteroidota bacterium]